MIQNMKVIVQQNVPKIFMLKIKEGEYIPKDLTNELEGNQDKQVYIMNGIWNIKRIGSHTNKIIEWRVKKIYANNNLNSMIPYELSNISILQNLEYLNISNNSIQSLEPITRSFFPKLRKLLLQESNFICNVSSIKKLWAPRLQTLNLSKNLILQYQIIDHLLKVVLVKNKINVRQIPFQSLNHVRKISTDFFNQKNQFSVLSYKNIKISEIKVVIMCYIKKLKLHIIY